MEAMEMHKLEHNFILCLLRPTSRQFSQGRSHSLLPLSLCFFCCGLPGYTVSHLCSLPVHKKTNWTKKGDASQAVSWMNYPPFSFLAVGPDTWETAATSKQWQGRRAGQKSWLEWIRCNMKLETVQLSPSAQRPAATMWECEVIQEAKAAINPGMPHH